MKLRTIIYIAFPALALSVPALAHASGLSVSDTSCSGSGSALSQTLSMPCPSDWWRQILELVFPNTGPLTGSDTAASSGLKSSMSAFLAVLTAIATGGLAWHVVAGAVATAHEGQVLGQRWHQVWSPIRVVLGWGMLAPIKSGLCIAQVLVLYVALWSGSLGNVIWSSYISGLTSPTLAAPEVQGTGELVRLFTEAELCRSAYYRPYLRSEVPSSSPSETDGGDTGENVSVSLGNLYNRVSAALGGGSLKSQDQTNRHVVEWDYGICGSISGPFSGGTIAEDSDSSGDNVAVTYDHARLVAIEAARKEIAAGIAEYTAYVSHKKEFPLPSSTEEAEADAEKLESMISDAMISAKKTLDTSFYNAAQSLVNSSSGSSGSVSALQDDASKYGWLSAGMYYVTISRLQSAASTLAADLPEMQVPRRAHDGMDSYIDKDTLRATGYELNYANEAIDSVIKGWDTSPDTGALNAAASAGSLAGHGASAHSAVSWIFRKIYALTDKYLTGVDASGANGSVIQQLSAFGNGVLNLVGGIIFAGVVGAAATGGLGAIAGLSALVSSGPLSFVGIILMLLVFVGVEHAYLVPMMPFIEFTFVAFQVLIEVCLAFIVLPVWALQHVRLDGAELVNEHQRSGYLLLMSLFLRIPVLMLCFLLSNVLLNAGVWLVTRSFSVAMLSATADSGGGIIGAVVMLILQGWLVWRLTTKSLRLMTEGPDLAARLLGWTLGRAEAENPSHFVGGLVGRAGHAGHGVGRAKQKEKKGHEDDGEGGGEMAGEAGGEVRPG